MALQPGTRVGHYELLSSLGAGGMGVVYRARDTKLGRDVAIKLLPDDVRRDPERLSRFEREARAVASLNHPGIVTLHAIEELDGHCFIVMELVDGRELSAIVPNEGLALPDLLDIATQLVRAIAAAHRGGILHRDLKPANVMVTGDGQVKVLDFGLAKFQGTLQGENVDPTMELTQDGVVVGTMPYMSPEQLQGKPLDQRSDIFSLGIILHEMASGRRPFSGPSAPELMSAILRDNPPPVTATRPQMPRQLDRILKRCLEKDPARRYRDLADLLYDLEALSEELTNDRLSPTPAPSYSDRSAAREPETRPPSSSEPVIRFCTTTDNVSLAYATMGAGPPLVRVLGWFTHLEMEWRWAAAREFWQRLARHHLLLRYDGRGMGLSERHIEELGHEQRLLDLEAVVDAAGLERFALVGMSEGGRTAITYAARHPERVSHLVVYGSTLDNTLSEAEREQWRGLLKLIKTGWGQESPIFRQVFTHLFLGTEADAEQVEYFNEMQRESTSAASAMAFIRANGQIDVLEDARRVRCPTLVVHRRGDRLISFDKGRKIAAAIPGARFLPLEGDNHWLLLRDPVVETFAEALEDFLGSAADS